MRHARVEHDGQPLPPARRHPDHVAGPQRLQRLGGLRPATGLRPSRDSDRSRSAISCAQPRRSRRSRRRRCASARRAARRPARGGRRSGPARPPTGRPGTGRTRAPAARAARARPNGADEVDRHVVATAGTTSAAGRCGCEASPATAAGSMPGAQTTTAWPSTSMPRRPARPVSWVYSPGVMSAWVSPFHLTSRSSTTVRAGMLMPSARVSVANTALTRPRTKQLLDDLLEGGQHPGVVGGDAAAAGPRATPSSRGRRRSSSGSDARCARSTTAAISSRSSGVVSRSPACRHCARRRRSRPG